MSVAFGQAWSSLYIHCLSYIHQHKCIEQTVEDQLALDHNGFIFSAVPKLMYLQ